MMTTTVHWADGKTVEYQVVRETGVRFAIRDERTGMLVWFRKADGELVGAAAPRRGARAMATGPARPPKA